MSQPSVQDTEIDGALGVVPTGSKALAVVGVCSAGANNTPTAFRNVPALVAAYGYGPAVEMAARHIKVYGQPAIITRTGQTTAGAMGAIDVTGVTGTASGGGFIVVTPATNAFDDFQVKVKIITGGTTGVTGITYQYSLDGGRTYSPTTALGTALILAIANSGVSFTFTTAKTFIAGDVFAATTTAPAPSASDVTTALTTLQSTSLAWTLAGHAHPIDGAIFDAMETAYAAMSAAGKPRAYIGHFRIPTDSETESAYKAAFDAVFASRATTTGSICAGAAQITSSVSGRAYRRPWSFKEAPQTAAADEHIDIADVNLGAAPGVSLVDANGNNAYHDESINPGLDDSRASVARTWDGDIQGVYSNRPRLLCPAGSDFTIMPLRRVMNLGRIAARMFLIRRLNVPFAVDTATGFIKESAAKDIEAGGRSALKAVLTGKSSGWSFVVHRDDNLLATKLMKVDIRIIPFAYVETITVSVGFLNPANAN